LIRTTCFFNSQLLLIHPLQPGANLIPILCATLRDPVVDRAGIFVRKLAVHLIGSIFHQQCVLVFGEDNADRRVIAFDVFLTGEVAPIHIHLTNIMVLHFIDLQVDQDKATQDTMVKNQINSVMGVIEYDAVLPSDEGKAFT
jgi:hypothetical protein